MKCSRMSWKNQWINIGYNAAKRDIPIERVLTGRPGIDEWIRTGFERFLKRRKPTERS